MTEAESIARPPLTGRKLALQAAVLAGVTAAVALAASLLGYESLSAAVWQMRLGRVLAAAIVGAGLGVAGMALQGLLRNPLAEPYILGISSGAGVGVLTGSAILGWVGLGTPALAWLGALATCVVVYGIAQRRGRLDPYVLLLSGVIVNVFNGAIMFSMLLFARPNQLLEFVRWGMGDVPQWIWVRPGLLALCAGMIGIGWTVLLLRGAAFNALGLGDEVAVSAGVSVHWLRSETFFVVALVTAATVALAGPVGFVGLIVPHICRLILGPDHRRLAVFSGFVGAVFLIAADTLCRVAGPRLGIGKPPVGIVTALAGGPFFIYLLRRRFRGPPA